MYQYGYYTINQTLWLDNAVHSTLPDLTAMRNCEPGLFDKLFQKWENPFLDLDKKCMQLLVIGVMLKAVPIIAQMRKANKKTEGNDFFA